MNSWHARKHFRGGSVYGVVQYLYKRTVVEGLPMLREVCDDTVQRPCSVVGGRFDSSLCHQSGNIAIVTKEKKKKVRFDCFLNFKL